MFARLLAAIDNFTAAPSTIIDGGDHVVALGRYRRTLKADGSPLDAEYCHVYLFRDGKVITVGAAHEVGPIKRLQRPSRSA